MREKGWNRHYQMNIAPEVKEGTRTEALKCLGLSPIFLKTTVIIQRLFNAEEYICMLIITCAFFLLIG